MSCYRTLASVAVLLLAGVTGSHAAGTGTYLTIPEIDPPATLPPADDRPYQPASVAATDTLVDLGGGQDECRCGQAASCSCAKKRALQKAAATAYKPVFYDNDFDYLCDPCYAGWHLGENLKRMAVGDWITLDAGGQFRWRQQSERNIRNSAAVPNRLGLTGYDDDFLLQRTRVYVNTEIGERVRVYVEGLDAYSSYERLAPRPIEENRYELQQLFLDALLWDIGFGKLTARVGRQELLYGAERLVSPLDWANTRRTFEGGKLMWQGEKWDIDALWVRPLRHDVDALDPPNLDRQMYGVYSTFKGLPCDKVDLYWLALDYRDVGYQYDTLGGRYYGGRGAWLYEAEGGVQFGRNGDDSDHSAGFATAGIGRKFDFLPWQPVLWGYYDWASGAARDPNALSGSDKGFHHYEPLVHKYLGFMDLYGRSNIEDFNAQLTMRPHEKLKLLLWYHVFRLANINDGPYNVDMTPFAWPAVGASGSRKLGQELDLLATIPLTARIEAQLGYSRFFAGEYYDTTGGVPFSGDADLYYSQLLVNF